MKKFNDDMIDAPAIDAAQVLVALQQYIDQYEFEYPDTFRATPTNKGREYHDKKVGCCGAFDTLLLCRSGTQYYIGLNYGH